MTNERNAIIDLLIERGRGQPPRPFTDEVRQAVVEYLSRCVADPGAWAEHLSLLRRSLPPSSLDSAAPPEQFARAVLSGGLAAASDGDLAGLVCNPTALTLLGERVAEEMPDAWLDALAEAGRRLADAAGLTPPTWDDLVGVHADDRLTVGALGGPSGTEADNQPPIIPLRSGSLPAEQCLWRSGAPADANGLRAEYDATWDPAASAVVISPGGFLLPSTGITLEAVWLRRDGAVATATSGDEFTPLTLVSPDGRPPRPGDCLVLRGRRSAPTVWDVELTVELS